MTDIALPTDPDLRDAFIDRLALGVRLPTTMDATTATFTPDLTTDEQAAVSLALDRAESETGLTAEGYAAIRSQMQTLRALRQMGRNGFMALSQSERDRLIYDNLVAVTQVFIAMQRDS